MKAAVEGSRVTASKPRHARHAVVGVRMTPDREMEVKMEAVRRGLSVAALFDEIWQDYMQGRPK